MATRVLGRLDYPVTLGGGALKQIDGNARAPRQKKVERAKPTLCAVRKLISSTGRGCENILVQDASSVVGRTCKNLAWVGGSTETKCVVEMNRNRHTYRDRPVLKVALTAHTQRSCPKTCSVLTGTSPHGPFKQLYKWDLVGKNEYACYLPVTTVERYLCILLQGGTGHHHRIARLEIAQGEEALTEDASVHSHHSDRQTSEHEPRNESYFEGSPRASPIPMDEVSDAPPPPKTALSPQCAWAVRPAASLPSSIHPPSLPLPSHAADETSTVVVDINASELFGEGGPLQGMAPTSMLASHKSVDSSLHASDLHTDLHSASPASKSNKSIDSHHPHLYEASGVSAHDLQFELTQPDASVTDSTVRQNTSNHDNAAFFDVLQPQRIFQYYEAQSREVSIDVLEDTQPIPQGDLHSAHETASSGTGSPQRMAQLTEGPTEHAVPYRVLPRQDMQALQFNDIHDTYAAQVSPGKPPRWQGHQSAYPQLMPTSKPPSPVLTEHQETRSSTADVFKPQLRPYSPKEVQQNKLFVSEVQTVYPLIKSPVKQPVESPVSVKSLQPSFLRTRDKSHDRMERTVHDETVVVDGTHNSSVLTSDMDTTFARTPSRVGSLNTSRALSDKYNITPLSHLTGGAREITPPQTHTRKQTRYHSPGDAGNTKTLTHTPSRSPPSREQAQARAQAQAQALNMQSFTSAASSPTMNTPVTVLKLDVSRSPFSNASSSTKKPSRPPPRIPSPMPTPAKFAGKLNVSFNEETTLIDPFTPDASPVAHRLLDAIPDMGPADRLLSTAMKTLISSNIPSPDTVTPPHRTSQNETRRSPPRPISVTR